MKEKVKHLVFRDRKGLFTLCRRPFQMRRGAWHKAETLADCTCKACRSIAERMEDKKLAELGIKK